MTAPEAEFFTAHELAAVLKVNVMTIYRYFKAGKLRAHKLGKEFRITRREVDLLLERTSTPGI